MREKTVKIYKFAELSDDAKEKARNTYRNFQTELGGDYEFEIGEFIELLSACGFTVHIKHGTRSMPYIFWSTNPVESGFNGTWSASAFNVDACAAIKANRPLDTRAHASMEAMAKLTAALPAGYAEISSGRDGCTPKIDCLTSPEYAGTATEWQSHEDALLDAVRDLCHEFARCIDAQQTYLNSDEVIDESIEANEYEFDEGGNFTN